MFESCVDCLKVRLSWTHGRDLLDESPLRGHEVPADSSPPALASNFSLLDVSWAHETQHPHTPPGVQIPIGQSRYQEQDSYFRALCAGRKEGCRRASGTDLQQNRLKTRHPAGARFYLYSHCCPSSLVCHSNLQSFQRPSDRFMMTVEESRSPPKWSYFNPCADVS